MDLTTQESIYVSFETLSQADAYYRWLANRVRPYIRGKTLEIGAGIGNFGKWLKDAAAEYHASDVDPRLLPQLQENFEHAFLWDVYQPFPRTDLYDVIISINVVEHLSNDTAALQALRERLNPDGIMIVIVPAMNFLFGTLDESFGHFRRYTKQKMTALLEQLSFKILKREYVNVIGMAGWFIYGKILRRNKLPHELCSHFNVLVPLLKLERPIAHFMGLSLLVVAQK